MAAVSTHSGRLEEEFGICEIGRVLRNQTGASLSRCLSETSIQGGNWKLFFHRQVQINGIIGSKGKSSADGGNAPDRYGFVSYLYGLREYCFKSLQYLRSIGRRQNFAPLGDNKPVCNF